MAYHLQMLQSKHTQNLMMKPAALAQELDHFGQQGFVLADMNDDKQTSTSKVTPTNRLPAAISESHTSKSLVSLHCACHKRPQVTAWRSPYSILGMGTVCKARHRRNCPWFSLQRSFQISIQYRFPWYLLNKAVDLSLSTSYGAGGLSLAPNLRIISVATGRNPAIDLVRSINIRTNARSLEKLMLELRQLFFEGRASPFDIDEKGRNLIHVSHSI